jgi:hypothetical protein
MHWPGSGFITIINYGLYSEAVEEENTILTENNFDLLTEDGDPVLVES